jgi:hypothetical protein
MNKYLTKFLSIINPFKDGLGAFQSQTNFLATANMASDALKEGDFDKFVKNFNPSNPFLSFKDYGCQLAINGNYDLFLKVEKVGIETDVIDQLFYRNLFDWSFSRDNIDIVKHLIDNGHFKASDIDDNSFLTIVKQDAEKLLLYILYDLNYQPTRNIITWLTVEDPNPRIISMIEKRDLFMELDGMKVNDVPKKNRPKI